MLEIKQIIQSKTQVQQHLFPSYLQDLHAPSIEWTRRIINDNELS